MDPDAPAGPANAVRPQIPETGAEAIHDGGDLVLVLSPGVTLTLGQDALLMSGTPSMAEKGSRVAAWTNFLCMLLPMQASLPPNPVVHVYRVLASQVRTPQAYMRCWFLPPLLTRFQGPLAHRAAYLTTTSSGLRLPATTGGY